jgi:hypothetical protein
MLMKQRRVFRIIYVVDPCGSIIHYEPRQVQVQVLKKNLADEKVKNYNKPLFSKFSKLTQDLQDMSPYVALQDSIDSAREG